MVTIFAAFSRQRRLYRFPLHPFSPLSKGYGRGRDHRAKAATPPYELGVDDGATQHPANAKEHGGGAHASAHIIAAPTAETERTDGETESAEDRENEEKHRDPAVDTFV